MFAGGGEFFCKTKVNNCAQTNMYHFRNVPSRTSGFNNSSNNDLDTVYGRNKNVILFCNSISHASRFSANTFPLSQPHHIFYINPKS